MTQSRKYHKTNFRERMTQTQHSLCNGRTFTRQTHVDLGLLRTEVPLHAGVRIGVEGDLDDAVLHGCHRRHLVRIVAPTAVPPSPEACPRTTATLPSYPTVSGIAQFSTKRMAAVWKGLLQLLVVLKYRSSINLGIVKYSLST